MYGFDEKKLDSIPVRERVAAVIAKYYPVTGVERPYKCKDDKHSLKRCAWCEVYFSKDSRHNCRQVGFVVKGRVLCMRCENCFGSRSAFNKHLTSESK